MEEYPGAGLSLSQLVYALEKRLSFMMDQPPSKTILHEEEIDEAVTKLPSTSIIARQLKNSLVPVNRLPPEVLAHIPTFRESEKDLINATAICKHWRRALVSTPALWDNIVCFEREDRGAIGPLIQMYFERSGSVPVSVQIPARASRLISPYTKRISRLTMFINTRLDLNEIAEHLSKSAPLIGTITFHVRHWDSHGLTLPPEFFEGFLSSAKNLALHGAILSPGPSSFSKLTKLVLETHPNGSMPTIVLRMLEHMPMLRTFDAKLNRMFPTNSDGDRVVTLPHLKTIAIVTDDYLFTPFVSPVLPSLCLPNAREVTMQSVNANGAPITPLLPLSFGERLPKFNVLPKASVALDKHINAIKFYSSDRSKLTISINSNVHYAFTHSTFGGLPFSSVRKLRVSFRSSDVDTLFFVHLLRFMRGLELLQIGKNSVGALTCWIEGDEQAWICPALTTLIIVDGKAEECVEVLKQARERAGVPIANVEVRHH